MGEEKSTTLRTIVAFSIAVLTLFSGLLGWQTGNISGDAASEYARAQRAELNRQKTASTNSLKAFEDYRAFLVYQNYFEQYKLVSIQLEKAAKADPRDEKLVEQLDTKRAELESLYLSSLRLFPNQFINRDGTYNLQEELGELNAAEGRKFDTNPDAFLKKGEVYDAQVSRMQIALILLAVALFFFAIVSTVEELGRAMSLVFIVGGYLIALGGVVLGVLNWSPTLSDSQVAVALAQQPTQMPAIATHTQQVTNTSTSTSVPIETVVPTRTVIVPTKSAEVAPPPAPAIKTWNFSCSSAKKEVRITIQWIDAADNEDGYRILRNAEAVASLPANAISFNETIPMPTGGKTKYLIEVFNAGGTSLSREMSFTC
jgi:hypothetical protein